MHQHTNTVIRNPIDRVDSASWHSEKSRLGSKKVYQYVRALIWACSNWKSCPTLYSGICSAS
jgi:hypothetical protein